MNIIKSNVQYIDTINPYEKLEFCGKTLYKFENDMIANNSKNYIKKIIENNDLILLEHLYIYMYVDKIIAESVNANDDINIYYDLNDYAIMSGSFRTFLEILDKYKIIAKRMNNYFVTPYNCLFTALNHEWPDIFDIENIPGSNEYKISIFYDNSSFENFIINNKKSTIDTNLLLKQHITHTLKFVCDKEVANKLVQHKLASYMQEPIDYCGCTKDKFYNEITLIEPYFAKEDSKKYSIWKNSCEVAEKAYFSLLNAGATPQEARTVLPSSLKTELIITATEHEWQYVVDYYNRINEKNLQMIEMQKILAEKSNHRIS